MSEKIEFLSAVLLTSPQPERLAHFYRDIVGLPLEDEEHGESHKHYGCELGDLHFAIHPIDNFPGTNFASGSVKLAFNVFDLNALVEKFKQHGVELAYPPVDRGFALMTAITDPDGNSIEFTQLSPRWFSHLKQRRQKGIDVVSRWEELKK